MNIPATKPEIKKGVYVLTNARYEEATKAFRIGLVFTVNNKEFKFVDVASDEVVHVRFSNEKANIEVADSPEKLEKLKQGKYVALIKRLEDERTRERRGRPPKMDDETRAQMIEDLPNMRTRDIADKYKMSPRLVRYYKKKHGIKNDTFVYGKLKGTGHKSYAEIKAENEKKARANCVHRYWIKRCSICGEILESDAGPNPRLQHEDH